MAAKKSELKALTRGQQLRLINQSIHLRVIKNDDDDFVVETRYPPDFELAKSEVVSFEKVVSRFEEEFYTFADE